MGSDVADIQEDALVSVTIIEIFVRTMKKIQKDYLMLISILSS